MSISIDNYASEFSNLYSDKTSSANSLNSTLSKDYSTAGDDELLEVCKEFEAYFTEQVFKALKSMVPENEEELSSTTKNTLDSFEGLLTQEYAKSSSEGEGLGIAQMLYDQMKRNYNL